METRKLAQNRNSVFSNILRISWRSWLPSRGNVVFTLVVIIALFWAQSAHALPWTNLPAAATSTTVWPYQGRLNNSAGIPLTAAVPMTFKLYNVSSAGTALWQEQWTSVQVTGGLFNVMLGSQIAIPQSIVTGNTSLWLGITVDTDSEMTPRIQLGSVPFSGQALAVPAGSIGTTQLANNSVTSAKILDGTIVSGDLAPGTATKMTMLSAPVTILDRWGATTDNQAIDISPWVPATAKYILIEMLTGSTDGTTVWLKGPGTTMRYAECHGETYHWDGCQGWVPMFSNRTIQWGSDATNGQPASQILQLVGYME